MSNGNVIQMPGKEATACPEPDLLDDLDAIDSGAVTVFFQTEAEQLAFAEGMKFAERAAETAQKQRDAVSLDMARRQDDDRGGLVDLLELALIALDSDPVKSAQPGAFFRKGLRERMRARIARERSRQ